ncbi:MAG: SHOCT domain-containing protein [Rickettsiales bacterium TMED289]|nr:MAG: SHOCT domain-containing protein [Rickettsiales bacterium TMED289]|tara:strand:+ start:9417 stop:9656 length:240 start_codon:yes stop_codon:yes gene_type:complete
MFIYIIYILVAVILLFVLYLAVQAITRGVEAKGENKQEDLIEKNQDSIATEILELKKLLDEGTINKEEFNKAKEKILKN